MNRRKCVKLCQGLVILAILGSGLYLGRSGFQQIELGGKKRPSHWQPTGAIVEHMKTRCDENLLHTVSQDRTNLSNSLWTSESLKSMEASGNVVQEGSFKNYPIVITQFPVMTDGSINISRYESVTPEKLEARKLDFMEALNKTLNHPRVFAVYVLYNQQSMPALLRSTFGEHSKLCVDQINNTYSFNDVLDYVHSNFQNKLVIITNGDVYPGEGLEKLNYDVMKKKRLLYAPARHGKRERRCKMYSDSCKPYTGAHDTYIFIPDGQVSEAGKKLLSFPWDDLGMETLVLKVYRDFHHYRLLNPCKVLFFYHLHCSRLRHRDRKWRINYTKDVIFVAPSNKLV